VARCSTCDHENTAGAEFCSGCGTALRGAGTCPGCGGPTAPGQRFCGECGLALAGAEAPPDGSPADGRQPPAAAVEGERKQVTVLFADIKGSMDLSRTVGVEEWWTLMQQFFTLVCDGVNRYGGWVSQFTGDGVMAVFGAPRAMEDHARRACHAALWTQTRLAAYADELERERDLALSVRMGLNSGEVVAGTIGESLDMEYATIGHAAGLAQRMESLAEPGGIYMTESTAKLVAGFFTLLERGTTEVKGGGGRLAVYELAGGEERQTAFAVAQARGLSPFVGRDTELTVLDDALKGTLAGKGQVIVVVAPAGTGKSRLCYEFLDRCRAAGAEVFQGHALAHTSTVPFGTALEVLRDYFAIVPSDSDEQARAKVLARVRASGEDLGDAMALLLELLGIAGSQASAPFADPEARQRRLFAALNRLLRASTEVAPAVVLVEDLHWLDSASGALLANLVAGVEGTRTLLLATSRPEHEVPWRSLPYCRELRLQALDRRASAALLEELLGPDRSLDGLAELVYEHADGNPFFIEEIVKTLAEGGTLEGVRGAYRLTQTVEEVEIPATVESVLAARIDRLDAGEKTVLQAAAVIGRQFSVAVLERVAGLSEQELADGLQGLLAAELILPGPRPGEYLHKHALAERVAYSSQLSGRRARLHAAAAEAIAATEGERLDELAALVAGHWERAGEPLLAAQWYVRAAAWAQFNDPREALQQWRRARALADRAPVSPERVELALGTRVAMLNLAWRLGIPDGETRTGFERETSDLYHEASALATESGNVAAETLTVAAYGAVRGVGGHLGDMAELGMRAVRLADGLGDSALKLSVLPGPLYGLFAAGRYAELLDLLETELAAIPADAAEVGGLTLICPYAALLQWRAAALAQTGSLAAAFASFEEALTLARAHGDFETESWIQMSIVHAAELAGGGHDALEHARAGLELAERTGGAFSLGLAWRYLGIAHLLGAEWREAIAACQSALSTWRPRQVGLEAEPHALTMLARAQLGLGAAGEALESAGEAVALAAGRGTHGYEIEARLALVEVLRTTGGAAAAAEIEEHLTRAGELTAPTGARTLAPRVHAELAELARLRGEDERCEQEAQEARRLFETVGAPLLAERLVQYTGRGAA
jgi:adenylate cyclase